MGIGDWRAEIDEIDRELLRLLNRRARASAQMAGLKVAAGLPLHDPERERTVLTNACQVNAGPLDERAVAKIFRRIMHESRVVQARVMAAARAAREVTG